MHLEGVAPPELVKLHGELIAFGWVEQNTGEVPICYRITPAGSRAMRQAQGGETTEELSETAESTIPRFPRKKRDKTPSPEPVAVPS